MSGDTTSKVPGASCTPDNGHNWLFVEVKTVNRPVRSVSFTSNTLFMSDEQPTEDVIHSYLLCTTCHDDFDASFFNKFSFDW